MKQTRAYGVEMETVGMVMLNFKHRSKSAYFAEQKRLRLKERERERRMQTGNMFKKKICVNGAGRQDYEGGEETLDEFRLSVRAREREKEIRRGDKNSIADKRITY